MKPYYFYFLASVSCLLTVAQVKAQYTFSRQYPHITVGRPLSYEATGGYITMCNAEQGNDYKVFMMKTDLEGDTQWTEWIDYGDMTRFVKERDEEGNIFMYRSNSCMKIDSVGNVIWTQSYGSDAYPVIYKNGYLWALYFGSDYEHFYLRQIDAVSGLEVNQYLVGQSNESSETWPCSIAMKDDGEISIIIVQQYFVSPSYVWGTTVYTKFAGSDTFISSEVELNDPEQIDFVTSIQYVDDELWGVTGSSLWTDVHHFVRFNTSGEIFSQVPVFLGEGGDLTINDFVIDNNQNAALLSEKYYNYSNRESFLVFISPDDSLTSVQSLPVPSLSTLTYCPDGGYLISGSYTPTGTYKSYLYLHKTDSLGLLTAVTSLRSQYNAHVYPNPVRDIVTICVDNIKDDKVGIYDIHGRLIIQLVLQNGEARWDTSDVRAGVYFYSVKGVKGKVVVRK